MKYTYTFAFLLVLFAVAIMAPTAAHADGGPMMHILPVFQKPIHGPGDLVPPKNPPYGHHPIACTPPLVLNEHGQCALPGDNTPPDPLPHIRPNGLRVGF